MFQRLVLRPHQPPRLLLGLLCTLGFAVSAQAASAATYTVIGTADSTAACAGTVCPSLRSAVDAANADPGSTVQLGAGTYTLGNGPGARVDTGELQVAQDTTITGAGAGSTTVVQSDAEDRVFDLWNYQSSVTLSNLTVSGGKLGPGAEELGAGIFSVAALTLKGVVVSGNTAIGQGPPTEDGCCQAVGGILTLQALTLDHSTVSANVATAAAGASSTTGDGGPGGQAVGGILATKGEQVTLDNSILTGNISTSGAGGTSVSGTGGAGGDAYGAIFAIDTAPVKVFGSTFSANVAHAGAGGTGATGGKGGSAYGGGIFIPDGTLDIDSSTFANNVLQGGAGGAGLTGTGGAGGWAMGGGVAGGSRTTANRIVNTTFYENHSNGGAGGPAASPGSQGLGAGGGLAENTAHSVTIVSSTFDANVAASAGNSWGGNLYVQWTPVTIAQTIFADGKAQNGSNCAMSASEVDAGHNLESTSSSQCGLLADLHDLIGVDPLLQPLTGVGGLIPTLALGPGSPAIGAGGTCTDPSQSGSPALADDERGAARPVPCDIGAYQSGSSPAGGGNVPGPGGSSGAGGSGSGGSGSGGSGSGGSGSGGSGSGGSGSGGSGSGGSGSTGSGSGGSGGSGSTGSGTGAGSSGTSGGSAASHASGSGPRPATASLAARTTVQLPVPHILQLRQSKARWREGRGAATLNGRRAAAGTVFSFALNTTASVQLTFARVREGQRVKGRCVFSAKVHGGKGRCQGTVPAGHVSFSGVHAGQNTIAFQGRVAGGGELAPGSYTVTVVASNGSAQSSSGPLRFTVTRP